MKIYLDNNATTPLIQSVLKMQVLALKYEYGNPSELYSLGEAAKQRLDEARTNIAKLIGAELDSNQVIFTGCATEANNAVFNSAIKLYPNKKHIVVSSVEHLSVLEVAKSLETMGYDVTYVPVNLDGELDLEYLQRSLKKDTLMVSIMTANNETGIIYPIEEIVQIVHSYSPDILIHTDAVQAIGKIHVDVNKSGVDFLTLSGHKFHAPKGVGALYIRGRVNFVPFFIGGHQEYGLRAGTENTASIIAMGEAALHAVRMVERQNAVRTIRDTLEKELMALPIESHIIGSHTNRLPNTTNIAFSNIDNVWLMLNLSRQGVYVSTGSACNSNEVEPSHVISAMGVPKRFQKSIRISLSTYTTQEEIDEFIKIIKKILIKERRL